MSADLRLAGTAIGCWLAAFSALFLTAPVDWLIAVVAAVVAALCGWLGTRGRETHRGGRRRTAAMIMAGVAAGIVCGAAATAARVGERDEQPLAGLVHSHATVTAGLVLSDDPRATGGGVGAAVTWVVSARLTWVQAAGGPRVTLGARVLVLAGQNAWRSLLPGQAVLAIGRLGPSRGGDLRAGVLSVRNAPVQVDPPPAVQRVAGTFRAGLQRACAALPAEPGGLLPGLVVGDTSRLDDGLAQDFRTTGLTHLTAVSGANCAIVMGLVLLLARWCRAGPRLAATVTGVALVGFVVLARPSPSVLRAAAMGGLALVALAAGRPRAAVPALGAGVVALIVVDPELATDAGFALSVLATAGLMLLAPGWAEALKARGVPGVLAEALAVPAAAQAACAPVIAAISASVSLTAIPANLLAAPAVAPATVLGVLAAVLSPVWGEGAAYLAWLASWPARWLVLVAHKGAAVPDGILPWPPGALGGLLLAGLLVALLIGVRHQIVRRLVLIASVATVVGAVPVRMATASWPPAGWFMVVCDVGQGDSIVMSSGSHAGVVIDAGPDPAPVDGCLRRLGIASVPLLLISHYHIDHIGGLDGVLRGRAIGRIVASPFGEPATGRAGVLRAAAARHTAIGTLVPGDRLAIGRVAMTVLGPVEQLTGTRSDPNNNSLVVRAVIDGHSILLLGDAEDEEQATLLTRFGAGALRADIMKVAHHGSAFQDPAFLDAVGTGVGLVSVGAGNAYGHPNPALIARLERGGMRVLRTDQSGDLAVTAHAGTLTVVARGHDPGVRR